MLCNVTLLKTNLSPSNTRLFNSKDEQNSFFDSLAQNSVTFTNVSYNGSRLFRLKGIAPLLNIDGYNYAIVYIPNLNVKYYSFIDNYLYINDNAYDLYLTLDYIQTYMFDIKLSNTIVKQRTLPRYYRQFIKDNGYIDKYLYYSNYYPYVGNKYSELLPLYTYNSNIGKYVKYLIATFKGIDGFENNGYQNSGYYPLIFPIIVNDDGSYTFSRIGFDNEDMITYQEYLRTRAGELINVSVVDYIPPNIITTSYNTQTGYYDSILRGGNYFTTIGNNEKSYIYLQCALKGTISKNVSTELLNRSPYVNLQIMRQGNNPQIIDILDFDISTKNSLNRITFDITISPIFPNDTIVKCNFIDNSIVFTIPAFTNTLAFSISSWQEYYSTHSASINDGLATKHAYDMEMLNNKTAGQIVNSTITGITGVGVGISTKKVGDIASSISGMATEFIGSAVSYENAKLGLEQEKALLELQWNDIKSSPNIAYNSNINDNAKIGIVKQSTYIAIKEPLQIKQIQYYHSRFGYEINIPIEDNSNIDGYLSVLDNTDKLSQGNKFDYVEYKGCVIFNGKIPQQACRRIEQILEQGIYFWYTNNIGDYEGNY